MTCGSRLLQLQGVLLAVEGWRPRRARRRGEQARPPSSWTLRARRRRFRPTHGRWPRLRAEIDRAKQWIEKIRKAVPGRGGKSGGAHGRQASKCG